MKLNTSSHLCDFGLATLTTAPSVPFLCKTVKGTFGYLAPEYFQHGKVSGKIDVYAFGVVPLELITGCKPIEAKRAPGDENLVLWVEVPDLLILDEPLAGLDWRARADVVKLLKHLKKELTLLVVSYDLKYVVYFVWIFLVIMIITVVRLMDFIIKTFIINSVFILFPWPLVILTPNLFDPGVGIFRELSQENRISICDRNDAVEGY